MRPNLTLWVLGVAVALSGCATPRNGNYAAAPAAVNAAMAADGAARLAALYPPERTRWKVAPAADDPFGTAFLRELRAKGYAVIEAPVPRGADRQTTDPAGLDLSYVVDRPVPSLYRVLLRVGPTTLTRAYGATGGGPLAPVGAWARLEAGGRP
jgi:hypothetical protein